MKRIYTVDRVMEVAEGGICGAGRVRTKPDIDLSSESAKITVRKSQENDLFFA